MGSAQLIVLGPGRHIMPPISLGMLAPMMARRMSRGYTLLGIGNVKLSSPTAHAVWVQQGTATLVNLQLEGSGSGAAVCCSPAQIRQAESRPCVNMIDCRVRDYPEAGVLLDGGQGRLSRCSFHRCGVHAIEVRQGGRLFAVDTSIEECSQGVVAYGGAQRVELVNCSIKNTRKEGVLAAGAYENAATMAQELVSKRKDYRSASSRRATEEAEAWAKQHARGEDLTVTINHCSVSNCGNFGLSLDSGCRVEVHGCRLERNDPFNVYVKGGTDAMITANQFVYGGKSAKSMWAQKTGGGRALAMAGAISDIVPVGLHVQ